MENSLNGWLDPSLVVGGWVDTYRCYVEVSRAFLQVAKQNPPMQVYVTVPTAPGFPNVPDRSLTGETRDLVCLYLGTNSKYSIVNCSCMSFPTWMQPTKNPRPFLYVSMCGRYVCVCMYVQVVPSRSAYIYTLVCQIAGKLPTSIWIAPAHWMG